MLATSLADKTGAEVVNEHGRRSIEETFRDTKDIRFGVGLKATHIGRDDRRDRLLILFAIAHAGPRQGLAELARAARRGPAQGQLRDRTLPTIPR